MVTDPLLLEGQAVYRASCAGCHGVAGQGGAGPRLNNGRVVERLPDIDDHVAVVREGRGGMPGFADKLTEAEIDAVVAYERRGL